MSLVTPTANFQCLMVLLQLLSAIKQLLSALDGSFLSYQFHQQLFLSA
ncbi:hypothetical protein WKH31_08105 [Metabacillus indicus]